MQNNKVKRCLLSSCNKVITGHPNKKFCSTKHKDKFHNIHNPRGKFAHLNLDNMSVESIEDTMHPQDPYCFGQE